jgi:adenosylcobyric acid synthase
MIKTLMFLGTGSDVGKSIAATAFCRIFKRQGINVAPFKAQNMSNNSYVTVEGGEIGRAQAVQAEAAGLLPSVHMNPILLKPSSQLGSQIVLQGKVLGQTNALDYAKLRPRLRQAVLDSFRHLEREYDLIVLEGAGSCCEMNLKQNDLVNLSMAKAVSAPCILVADIDRGGVFAQLIGTYHLMTPKERSLIIGFIINKFRGDPRLFRDGMEYIQHKTGKPVLGLVPYFDDIHIDSEDAVAVQKDKRPLKPLGTRNINIAVLKLPAISNFTDLEILETEPDVVLNYLSQPRDLSKQYDALILPGTKNTLEDALWLSRTGWKQRIQAFAQGKTWIWGLCGGYQLLGRTIRDPFGVESRQRQISGLGLLPVETVLENDKVVRKVQGRCLFGNSFLSGYEIHMGRTRLLDPKAKPFVKIHEPGLVHAWEDGCYTQNGRIAGTYVHGLLDHPAMRASFLNRLRKAKKLKTRPARKTSRDREKEFDRLADHFEKYCDLDRIFHALKLKA